MRTSQKDARVRIRLEFAKRTNYQESRGLERKIYNKKFQRFAKLSSETRPLLVCESFSDLQNSQKSTMISMCAFWKCFLRSSSLAGFFSLKHFKFICFVHALGSCCLCEAHMWTTEKLRDETLIARYKVLVTIHPFPNTFRQKHAVLSLTMERQLMQSCKFLWSSLP